MATNAGLEYVRVNATADGDNTVITGRSGELIQIIGYALNVNAAGVITLQDSGTPTIFATFELTDGGGVAYPGTPEAPAFVVPEGNNFEISNAVGVDTLGHITFLRVRGRG